MKWMHSLGAIVAATVLLGPTASATVKRPASQPSVQPVNEQKLIKDSGYTGWRAKWANINQIGDRNLCGGLDFYSLQKQIGMGKQVAQQVMQTTRLIRDPVVTAYVNKVGQNIVRNSDARVPYTFHVVDSNDINAFALPGGFVFVNSGVILHANDEAELAGVMGHEIAHVAACHGAKQESKADIAQAAMIPLSIFLPYGWAGYGIYEGVNAAVPLAFLKFSRVDEAQADYLGLEYMYKAGYDPNAFISFFEKVAAQEHRQPSSVPVLFSDHPQTASRIQAVQREIATILPPRPEYIVDTSRFERVKQRLEHYEAGQKLQMKQQNKPTLERKKRSKNSKQNPNDNVPVLKRRH